MQVLQIPTTNNLDSQVKDSLLDRSLLFTSDSNLYVKYDNDTVLLNDTYINTDEVNLKEVDSKIMLNPDVSLEGLFMEGLGNYTINRYLGDITEENHTLMLNNIFPSKTRFFGNLLVKGQTTIEVYKLSILPTSKNIIEGVSTNSTKVTVIGLESENQELGLQFDNTERCSVYLDGYIIGVSR